MRNNILTSLAVQLLLSNSVSAQDVPHLVFQRNNGGKYSERDYDMERLGLNPYTSHYYRDDRGGLDFFLDAILPHSVTDTIEASWKRIGCVACRGTTRLLHMLLGNRLVKHVIVETVLELCPYIIPYIGYVPSTCPGIINQQFTDSIYPMLVNQLLSADTMCVFEFKLCDQQNWQQRDLNEELFDLINTKPQIAKTNDYINNLYKQHRDQFRSPGREPIKIALISDLHLDYDYTPGMNNDCGKPLCCRSDSGPGTNANNTAGKWGDFKCDLNKPTFDTMLAFIKDEIRPDVVMWGGDSIPHNIDTLTLETNVQIMKNVTQEVKDGLAGLHIYPTIGNHDTYPQDVIAMSIPKENEAINEWSPSWNIFIENPEQIQNFQDWGYYSVPFKNAAGEQLGKANTKLISLNTNICYNMNWQSMLQFEDPGNMLGWLEKELSWLEQNNGTAIIMSHVPNQDECNREFGRRFHGLLDRYQTVLRWGMYSHTHQEQYQILTDLTWRKPIGMNFVVGSGTTYQGKPPSFNVMYLDPETMLPVDYESYAFELEHANQFDEPRWSRKFNYTETYNLPDMSPQSFYDHSMQIYYNQSAAIQYRTNRFLGGPGAGIGTDCDWGCRMIFFCQTMANDYDEWQFCRDNDKVEFFNGEGLLTIEQFIDHAWFYQK